MRPHGPRTGRHYYKRSSWREQKSLWGDDGTDHWGEVDTASVPVIMEDLLALLFMYVYCLVFKPRAPLTNPLRLSDGVWQPLGHGDPKNGV